MGPLTRVAIWIGAASLAVLAAVAAAEQLRLRLISDDVMVWCDANRALVGLAADTLGILPEDLGARTLNLVGDDPDDQVADLSDLSVLDALRLFRAIGGEVPPQQLEGVGFRTDAGFEDLNVLGPRALDQAGDIVTDWLAELDGGWSHRDARRACLAAEGAFR